MAFNMTLSTRAERPPASRPVDKLRYPNGDPLAAVNCQLDMSTHAVTRADLASEPSLDDKAVEYVRSQGLCMEEAGLFSDSWRPSQGEYWMP
jgi:hypothetical protein